MVRKTSILERLKNRWKSPSGLRVDRGGGESRANATGTTGATGVADTDPAPLEGIDIDANTRLAATPGVDPVTGRKLSPKEEAALAVREGLQEPSDLLRGVHARLGDQSDRARALAAHVEAMPAAGRAQHDVLRQMSAQLERQNDTSVRLAAALGTLPDALHGVHRALERVASSDERTVQAMGEFRNHMERVQSAMERLVDSAAAQAQAAQVLARDRTAERHSFVEAMRAGRERDIQALVASMAEGRQQDVERLEQATNAGVGALQRLHDQQAGRLDQLARDGGRFGQLVVVLLTLTFFAIVGVLGLMILR